MEIGADNKILELAITKEIEANHFYLALAGRVTSESIRKVFEELALEELEHKAKLELELFKQGRTVETEGEQEFFEPDDHIESDSYELDIDYLDVLKLGVAKEDAAFRFYINLISQAQNQGARDVLLALAEEEVKHKIRFENEYNIWMEKNKHST